MCNKCSNLHSELFQDHHKYNLGEEKIILTELCKEENHKIELKLIINYVVQHA